jgi:membrane protease YdiL (CAAX protease family)
MKALLNRTSMRVLVTVIIFGLLVVPIPIPLRVLVLACSALIWTFLEAGSINPLGFSRHPPRSTLIWGVGIAIVMIAIATFIQPQIERLLGIRSDLSSYRALAGNASTALKLLGFALTSAAFGEEVLFRGLLLHQITAIFGSSNAVRRVAIATSASTFGLAHYIQGPLGIVTTGAVGLVFAWAWFRSGRNLWALILAHALIDTHGIAMLYFGLI